MRDLVFSGPLQESMDDSMIYLVKIGFTQRLQIGKKRGDIG